jgi:cyclohexyl-isocyanide hydratase
MRWLYHLLDARHPAGDPYAPGSLAREGFVHCSWRDAVAESARLHFAPGAPLDVLQIDPRRLDAPVTVAATPRGPMPHVHGEIPGDAIRARLSLDALGGAPDEVRGTRFGLLAFDGMTLLDLVGVLDPLSRIASMGLDPEARCSVISADGGRRPWAGAEATLEVERKRVDLDEFDVLVVPGGLGTRRLAHDPELAAWLRRFPPNRLAASVCTGALLLGAAGRLRGRRATTHASALELLTGFGATPVRERVVDEGQLVTAAGVTAAIDLGIHLVRRLVGDEAAARVAAQMEWPGA